MKAAKSNALVSYEEGFALSQLFGTNQWRYVIANVPETSTKNNKVIKNSDKITINSEEDSNSDLPRIFFLHHYANRCHQNR